MGVEEAAAPPTPPRGFLTVRSGFHHFRPLTKDWISQCLQVIEGFLASAEDFASAEATKGLSDRPLETFGPIRVETFAGYGVVSFIFSCWCVKIGFFQQSEAAFSTFS